MIIIHGPVEETFANYALMVVIRMSFFLFSYVTMWMHAPVVNARSYIIRWKPDVDLWYINY